MITTEGPLVFITVRLISCALVGGMSISKYVSSRRQVTVFLSESLNHSLNHFVQNHLFVLCCVVDSPLFLRYSILTCFYQAVV